MPKAKIGNENGYSRNRRKNRKVFNKTTPTGRLSKVKTRNLTSFLCVLVMIGIEKIKKDHDEKTFKKYMNELKKCGITEKYIREEHEKERFKRKSQKVEYVELVFDLNNQVPEGYILQKANTI